MKDRPVIYVRLEERVGAPKAQPQVDPWAPFDWNTFAPKPASEIPHDRHPAAPKPPKQARKADPVDVSDKIIHFRYSDEERMADKLELTINNEDMSQYDNPAWRKGGILHVSWGYPGNMSPTKKCVIQKISGGRQMKVEAHGLEMLMNKAKVMKVFKGKTLDQIAKEVMTEYTDCYGANGKLLEDPAGTDRIKIMHAVQHAQTDAAFLSGLARKYGYHFYLDEKGARFERIDDAYKRSVAKQLTWFSGDGEWLDFQYENDWKEKPHKIVGKGINPETGKPYQVEGSEEKTDRAGLAKRALELDAKTGIIDHNAIYTPPDPTKPGSSSLDTTIEKLKTVKADVDRAASTAHKFAVEGVDVGHTSITDPALAQHHVNGKYKKRRGHAHQLSGTIVGDPSFAAKTVLKVEGISRRLSGRWAVKTVEHTLDHSGYICHFKAERDADNGYGLKGEHKSGSAQNKTEAPAKEEDHLLPAIQLNSATGVITSTTVKESDVKPRNTSGTGTP